MENEIVKNREYYENLDKRTLEYKKWKKEQEIDELGKLELENIKFEGFLNKDTPDYSNDHDLPPDCPTEKELGWLKKIETMIMSTGPYPSPYDMRQKKSLLERIEYYKDKGDF